MKYAEKELNLSLVFGGGVCVGICVGFGVGFGCLVLGFGFFFVGVVAFGFCF